MMIADSYSEKLEKKVNHPKDERQPRACNLSLGSHHFSFSRQDHFSFSRDASPLIGIVTKNYMLPANERSCHMIDPNFGSSIDGNCIATPVRI